MRTRTALGILLILSAAIVHADDPAFSSLVAGRIFRGPIYRGPEIDFHFSNRQFIEFDEDGRGTVLYGDILVGIFYEQNDREVTYWDSWDGRTRGDAYVLYLSEDGSSLSDSTGAEVYRDQSIDWYWTRGGSEPELPFLVTARAEIHAAEGKGRAFDGLYAPGEQNQEWSKWLDDGGVPSGNDPSWIRVEYPQARTVRSLTIVSANDDFGRDPEVFALLASNDGAEWTILGSWAGQEFSQRFESRSYAIAGNVTAYRIYKLEITKNDEDVAMTQLCEIILESGE